MIIFMAADWLLFWYSSYRTIVMSTNIAQIHRSQLTHVHTNATSEQPAQVWTLFIDHGFRNLKGGARWYILAYFSH